MYYYHHPEQIPETKPTQDGFYNPFDLVVDGWMEWKRTGILPDPDALASRLKRRWKDDIEFFNRTIEEARPAPPDKK